VVGAWQACPQYFGSFVVEFWVCRHGGIRAHGLSFADLVMDHGCVGEGQHDNPRCVGFVV